MKKFCINFVFIQVLLLISLSLGAKDFFSGKVKKLKWDNLEVIYLEDDRFPTYQFNIYFADGALSDGSVKGVTSAAFNFMTLGTRRFNRQDIADNLEFYGTSYGSNVTHEFSSYSVSGLVKDIGPTVKKICHLFQDASYPKEDLNKEKKRILDSFENLVSSPGALASRAFREESLSGTPYSYPAEGKTTDVKKWNKSLLSKKLDYFNKSVKKRIYITGPKEVLLIKNVVNNECGWKGQGTFERVVNYKKPTKHLKPKITLIPIPQANQAQVRIGKFLSNDEINEPELMQLGSHFLGGGFTSRLMRVLRVESGLTYGVGAFAGGQKQYGRAGISTSTKVESVGLLLEKTKETIKKASAGEISPANLLRAQGSLAGSYPFGFESTSSYLSQLTYLDHRGEPYSSLFDFPEKVRAFNSEQVAKIIQSLYGWEEQSITIVGPRSLKKILEKYGDVTVKNYKKFL